MPALDKTKPNPPRTRVQDCLNGLLKWCKAEPLGAVLVVSLIATLIYFYWSVDLFLGFRRSVALWAWEAWTPESEQEHSRLVIPIFLGLLWYHRDRLRIAAGAGSNLGLLFAGFGVLLYVLSARMLEARYGILSVPFLIFGTVMYLWGRKAARVLLFPCAFFIFAVPMGAIEQATNRLQFIITGLVGVLSNMIGVSIRAVGTTLTATDGTFNFEIAEGCSGVRSLIAMTMLTAVYVHLTQKELWKKLLIFAASGFFAIIGNIGRIFTIILSARFIDKDMAGNLYHDNSALIFFPIALAAMLAFSRLLNRKWEAPAMVRYAEKAEEKKGRPVTYDY